MKHNNHDDLRQLQHAFANALQDHNSPITEAIVNGTFDAQQQLQIYRNHFIVGLTEILAITYPSVRAMIGDTCFSQLAQQHILHSPLTEPDVSHYGEGLHNTITNTPSLNTTLPYLKDLALIEWYRDRAAQMPTQHVIFPMKKLQQLQQAQDPQRFSLAYFHIPAATFVLNSAYCVGTLWQQIQQAQTTAAKQSDPFAHLEIHQPQSIVIQQRERQLFTYDVPASLAAFILHCQQQRPLSEASNAMLEHLPLLLKHQLVDDIIEVKYG